MLRSVTCVTIFLQVSLGIVCSWKMFLFIYLFYLREKKQRQEEVQTV